MLAVLDPPGLFFAEMESTKIRVGAVERLEPSAIADIDEQGRWQHPFTRQHVARNSANTTGFGGALVSAGVGSGHDVDRFAGDHVLGGYSREIQLDGLTLVHLS